MTQKLPLRRGGGDVNKLEKPPLQEQEVNKKRMLKHRTTALSKEKRKSKYSPSMRRRVNHKVRGASREISVNESISSSLEDESVNKANPDPVIESK